MTNKKKKQTQKSKEKKCAEAVAEFERRCAECIAFNDRVGRVAEAVLKAMWGKVARLSESLKEERGLKKASEQPVAHQVLAEEEDAQLVQINTMEVDKQAVELAEKRGEEAWEAHALFLVLQEVLRVLRRATKQGFRWVAFLGREEAREIFGKCVALTGYLWLHLAKYDLRKWYKKKTK